MLYSIYGQSYDNWHIILIDDVSDFVHVANAKDWLDRFDRLNNGRVTAIWNAEKRWEVANVLNGISLCNDDDIICRIDADDALCDLDALMILNQVYMSQQCDVAWSMHRWGFSDKNISGPLSPNVDVYKHPWVTSHLKTFRKRLINGVPYENFINMNRELVKRCGDQAIYLPVLKRAQKPIFVPRPFYRYTINDVPETYQTDDARFQKAEADFIRARGYISEGKSWEEFINV